MNSHAPARARFVKNAFTLVEILATIAILSIIAINLLYSLSEQHRGTTDIVNKVIAANFSKDVIDYLKSLPYADADASFNGVETYVSSAKFKDLPPLREPFIREVEILEFKNKPLVPGSDQKVNYKLLKVNVRFDKNVNSKVNLIATLMVEKFTK
jgi:prepilin-type N-terminal cleavage/methylation domain-containing protein